MSKLPKNWEFTKKNFHHNLEESGVVNHFYWDPEINAIYQVTNLRKMKGGEIGIIEFNPNIEADIRFVNPKNPKRTRKINNKYFTGSNTSYNLGYIFYDNEVKLK